MHFHKRPPEEFSPVRTLGIADTTVRPCTCGPRLTQWKDCQSSIRGKVILKDGNQQAYYISYRTSKFTLGTTKDIPQKIQYTVTHIPHRTQIRSSPLHPALGQYSTELYPVRTISYQMGRVPAVLGLRETTAQF